MGVGPAAFYAIQSDKIVCKSEFVLNYSPDLTGSACNEYSWSVIQFRSPFNMSASCAKMVAASDQPSPRSATNRMTMTIGMMIVQRTLRGVNWNIAVGFFRRLSSADGTNVNTHAEGDGGC